MQNHSGKTLRSAMLCLLPFATASAHATESLVCDNDVHSIQVLCSSIGCDSFNLYVGPTMQSVSTWKVVRSDIDETRKTIIFKAINPARRFESIELHATRNKGILRISNHSSSVSCDWSAFEL